jgi:HlyD family secretion protein
MDILSPEDIMKKKQTFKYILAIVISLAIVLPGCTTFSPKTTPTIEAPTIDSVAPIVSATGVVQPAQWARLSMSIPGIVAEVLIKQGDRVETGQVLARLKGREDTQAAITAAKFEVEASAKALDDLSEAADSAKIQALQTIAINAKQVKEAQYQVDNFTIPTDQAGMTAMQAVDKMKETLDKARVDFEPYKNKPDEDETRIDLKDALDEAQSDYNAAIRRLELETNLQVAEENLQNAREDFDKWSKGPDPKDVTVAQARLDNAQAALSAAEAALGDLELVAPFGGTISELDIREGEWVMIGQPLLLLADLKNLRAETTDLNEIDAARLKVGQTVKVTFDALPDVNLTGTVSSIAPKATEGAGVNYTVVIELSEIPEALRWGMTAFVDITVE